MAGILRGALAGAGAAMEKVGFEWMTSELAKERAATLEELRSTHQAARDVRQEGFAVAREDRVEGRAAAREIRQDTRADARETRQETRADTRQAASFGHSARLADAQRVWQGEQNAQQRTLTREQIAASKSIAESNKAVSLQIAKLGGSAQSDKDGNMFFMDREGGLKPIMDPNNPGQQLKGQKDLTPAAKAYTDVLKAQLVAIDKKDTPGQQDDALRVKLNTELLNVLTGGIGNAGATQSPGRAIVDPFRAGVADTQGPVAAALVKEPPGTRPADPDAASEAGYRGLRGRALLRQRQEEEKEQQKREERAAYGDSGY